MYPKYSKLAQNVSLFKINILGRNSIEKLKYETFGSIFTVKIRQMNQNSDPKKPPKSTQNTQNSPKISHYLN